MSSPTKKWYRETFKNELSDFNPPSAPRVKAPNLQVPTLKVDLNKEGFLEKHVENNKIVNNRMDHLIQNMEDCKKNVFTNSNNQKTLKTKSHGNVKQRTNSIENKIQKTANLRNTRLNSWARPPGR